MTTALWVAFGGAIGTLARYLTAGALNFRNHPWGTVTVNLVGSFLLGVMVGYWGMKLTSTREIALAVGLLGGFTTFSTFMIDTLYLWQKGDGTTAAVSLGVSIIGGLTLAGVGLVLGRVGA